MGTDLFKQGIERDDDLSPSSMPVVEDPTGSLNLSRTVTPAATGPKVLPLPEPDPDLLALFAPQADGDFDADGLGDQAGLSAATSSTGDWEALLDDSIPVRSLAKKSARPSPALTAELEAIKLVGAPAKPKRTKKAKQRSRSGRRDQHGQRRWMGLLPTALARPTADNSTPPNFSRSADAFTGTTSTRSGAVTGQTEAIAKQEPLAKGEPVAEKEPPTQTSSASDEVALALLETLGKKSAAPETGQPEKTKARVKAPTPIAGSEAILSTAPDPRLEARPVDTEIDPYRAVRGGVEALRSRRRLVLFAAAVVCLVLLGAVLITRDSDDGGAETTADTEEAAAQNDERDDAEPVSSTTIRRSSTTARDTDSTSGNAEASASIGAEIAAATVAAPASSTTERSNGPSDEGADGSSVDSADATTGTDDTATSPTSTPDGNSTTSTPDSTVTPSTTCTGVTWNLVVDEGFDGSSLDTGLWAVGEGAAGEGIQGSNAVGVANGALNITAQMLDDTLVSGGVQHRTSLTYGRYEIRVRSDQDADGVMGGRIQTAGSGASHVIYDTAAVSSPSSWHTMVVEWTPTSVRYYMDDNLVRTVEDGVSSAAQTLSVRYDASAATVASNVTMQVDYIKIWEYGGGC